ncbi:MAG: STAS domain-containing protein [Anaerolineales bacterium]
MDNFSSQIEPKGNIVVVHASGRVDSETAPTLETELLKAVALSPKLILNLKHVDYMSSAGIRAVVKAAQAAEQRGGALKLAAASELIESVLYTVGISDKVKSYLTVENAIMNF